MEFTAKVVEDPKRNEFAQSYTLDLRTALIALASATAALSARGGSADASASASR